MASNASTPIMQKSAKFLGDGVSRPGFEHRTAHDRTFVSAGFNRDERKKIKKIVKNHHEANQLGEQNETWTNLKLENKKKAISDLHAELVSNADYRERVLKAWDYGGSGGAPEHWFAEKIMWHCHHVHNKREDTKRRKVDSSVREVAGDSGDGGSEGLERRASEGLEHGASEELEHGVSGELDHGTSEGADTARLC